MSTDVISDIASYLDTGGYGTVGTNIFIEELQTSLITRLWSSAPGAGRFNPLIATRC